MSGSLDKHELRTLSELGGGESRFAPCSLDSSAPSTLVVQSMGLKPSAEDVNAMLMAIGAEDRLIQLDEFEDVSPGHGYETLFACWTLVCLCCFRLYSCCVFRSSC